MSFRVAFDENLSPQAYSDHLNEIVNENVNETLKTFYLLSQDLACLMILQMMIGTPLQMSSCWVTLQNFLILWRKSKVYFKNVKLRKLAIDTVFDFKKWTEIELLVYWKYLTTDWQLVELYKLTEMSSNLNFFVTEQNA